MGEREEIEHIPPSDVESVDTCMTCGKALTYSGRGKHPKFCDAHKPVPARRGRNGPRAPANPRTTHVIGKILIILTVIMAHRRMAGMAVQNDAIEDALTLTDDEAEAIARPLARWSSNSTIGAKVINPIVENEDLIDAGIALWEYNRRVTKLMRELAPTNVNRNPAQEVGSRGRGGSGVNPRPKPPDAPSQHEQYNHAIASII